MRDGVVIWPGVVLGIIIGATYILWDIRRRVRKGKK